PFRRNSSKPASTFSRRPSARPLKPRRKWLEAKSLEDGLTRRHLTFSHPSRSTGERDGWILRPPVLTAPLHVLERDEGLAHDGNRGRDVGGVRRPDERLRRDHLAELQHAR